MAEHGKGDDATYFGSVAESYDRLQPIIAGSGYSEGLTMMVELVRHERLDAFRFVELGCGTAELSRRVLERFPRSTGIGIDSESAMVEVARKKLASYGDRFRLCEADVGSCDLPACDLVLSSYVFHHVAPRDLRGMLARIAGALEPDGCLILLDQMKARTPWGGRLAAQGRRIHQRHVAAAIAAGRATQAEVGARWELKRRTKSEGMDVEFIHTAEDVLDVMLAAGFNEAGLVWRRFASTILVAFAPAEPSTAGEQ